MSVIISSSKSGPAENASADESRFPVQWQWLNDGVAYLYEPCHVAIALLDAENKVVQRKWMAGSNPQNWTPGQCKTETAQVGFPALPVGSYKLAVGLFPESDRCSPPIDSAFKAARPTGGTSWSITSMQIKSGPASHNPRGPR